MILPASILLLWCLVALPASGAEPSVSGWRTLAHLPPLAQLEAHPDSGLLALVPEQDLLLHLGPAGERWRQVGGSGRGPGAFRRPSDIDASQGLRILVLDRENRRLCAFSRSLAPLSIQALPPDEHGDCDRPALLAAGGAGLLLAADPVTVCVRVSRNDGRNWQNLLDYGLRADSMDHIDGMALAGLDLWLLQRQEPASLLVRLGIDHTLPVRSRAPGLLLIRRDGRAPDGLARLWRTADGLRLEDGQGTLDLPPLPADSDPLDFLRLGRGVWLSRPGAPALYHPGASVPAPR